MYRPEFVNAYKKSGSTLPIHAWEKFVASKLPQFQSKEDIYAPAPIFIKIRGGINEPQSTIKLSVPTTSPTWYQYLTKTLENMTKISGVDVYTNTGECLKNLEPKALFCAGECDLKDKRGNIVRLENMVTPPIKMSTNKNNTLKNWWTQNTDSLARILANKLKDMNTMELENACQPDALIQNTIQTYLESNAPNEMSWNEFIDNFGNDNNRASAKDIAKKILFTIRKGMEHNEEQIQNYQAVSSNLGGKSMFKKTTIVQSKYKDGALLYQDIIEDALTLPHLGKSVVDAIRYGTKSVTEKPKLVESSVVSSDWHPLQSFYQNHYYPAHGKLPGHIMQEFNKTSGKIYNGFKGNSQEAIDRFMLYSGRAIDPVGIIFDKKWREKRRQKREAKKKGTTANVKRQGKLRRFWNKVTGKKEKAIIDGREFTANDNNINGPRLIDLEDVRQMNSQMPRLIDLEDVRQTSSQMPRLIDLEADSEYPDLMEVEIPSNRVLSQPLWKTQLPSIADLLNN